MQSNKSYTSAVEEMERELVSLQDRAARLRRAVKSLRELTGGDVKKVKSPPQSRSNCPTDMVELSVRARIRKVLEGRSEVKWTAAGLTTATYLTVESNVRTNLSRMERDGEVHQMSDGSWMLGPTAADSTSIS